MFFGGRGDGSYRGSVKGEAPGTDIPGASWTESAKSTSPSAFIAQGAFEGKKRNGKDNDIKEAGGGGN